MGTFHHHSHELHGITVVVDTAGPKVWIGRCEDVTDAGVILLDVDSHDDGADGKSKEEYVRRVADFGFWKKHDRVVVPNTEVVSIRRLGQI